MEALFWITLGPFLILDRIVTILMDPGNAGYEVVILLASVIAFFAGLMYGIVGKKWVIAFVAYSLPGLALYLTI